MCICRVAYTRCVAGGYACLRCGYRGSPDIAGPDIKDQIVIPDNGGPSRVNACTCVEC